MAIDYSKWDNLDTDTDSETDDGAKTIANSSRTGHTSSSKASAATGLVSQHGSTDRIKEAHGNEIWGKELKVGDQTGLTKDGPRSLTFKELQLEWTSTYAALRQHPATQNQYPAKA